MNSIISFRAAWRGATLGVLLMALILTGCDSGSTPVDPPSTTDAPTLTPQDEALLEKLDQTAQILTELAAQPDVVAAVQEAVAMRSTEGYDEDVAFASLLGRVPPEASANPKRTAAYAKVGEPFARAFRTAIGHRLAKSTGEQSELYASLEDALVENSITLYWPYSESFQSKATLEPTVTFHPLDPDVHQNVGYRAATSKDAAEKSLTTTMVDDLYAQELETWVVRPCESSHEQGGECTYTVSDGPAPTGTYYNGIPEAPTIDPANDVLTVIYGDMQCRENTDSVFSGGPDYRIARLEPKLDDNSNLGVSDYSTYFEVNQFSRGDCKNKVWEYVGTTWDDNWEATDLENGMVVWDHDRFGGKVINLGLDFDGTILGIGINAEVEASIPLSNGAALYKQEMNRDAYLVFNRSDCNGHNTRGGWCVRAAGSSFRFTLPWQIWTKPAQ